MVLPRAIANGEISVSDYHEVSKHHVGEYAPGPLALDWDQQPNPFRTFAGAPAVELPLPTRTPTPKYHQLSDGTVIQPQAPSLEALGQLLAYSMGISCWKVYEEVKFSLRCNPSSGNLHPTETYLAVQNFASLLPGIYHYDVHQHALERRYAISPANLPSTSDAPTLWIGLTSIPWREAWKYGERSYRYCQLDIGHAVAAIRMSAAALGWTVTLVESIGDDEIAALFGIDRSADYAECEREIPEVVLQLHAGAKSEAIGDLARLVTLVQESAKSAWHGVPNRLSTDDPVEWPLADVVPEKTKKPPTDEPVWTPPAGKVKLAPATDESATDIFSWRRSAQAFDDEAVYPKSAFARFLDTLSPKRDVPPLDLFPWEPRLHPVFFVHNVQGIAPGVYIAPRSESGEALLRSTLRDKFDWKQIDSLPTDQPFYQLVGAKCRKAAKHFSCNQAIAADSCFTIAMIADFADVIEEGAWKYRQLYWEAGALGQLMYLEAEVANFRGTGIGCFFDLEIHQILGIHDTSFQCLYNFTVGFPFLDPRLQTIAPYAHLNERQ
ncbi:SagB/ThcOx family dehydrogenase [Blastopirellula sp. JC732]|uniref:SagB/ThcOx family dehydrogenase n=1 Tax=Blastopirellula sediminis TaxID=2894196 RepID=A0A9X1MM52_9BACT|nr:SagB/ThcOx family dehydrogenase [Blastopirellula sediminis]MCC9608433.1 SagB/ThcOx family dehydrogenase [Blastopirellula sediminis]MCC9628790.1 SagB/ThcOx family dehydrogenase [Blastopirellula sediminis]